jgi:hypothetical protein
MGLQLGKDMALKDPKRGMMYFLIYLIFSLMGFKMPKSVVPLVPKRFQSEVGSIDQPLTTCSTSGSSVHGTRGYIMLRNVLACSWTTSVKCTLV